MTALNYVRLLGGEPRKGPGVDNAAGQATLPGMQRGRAHNARPAAKWQDQKSQSSSSVSTTSPIT